MGSVANTILLAGEIKEAFHIKLFKSMCFYLALVIIYIVKSGQRIHAFWTIQIICK